MKVDPYNYPLIIIVAFVIGFILAIGFGFFPQHTKRQGKNHGIVIPATVQTVQIQDLNWL